MTVVASTIIIPHEPACGSSPATVLWKGKGMSSLFEDHPHPSPPDKEGWTMSPECRNSFAESKQEFAGKSCRWTPKLRCILLRAHKTVQAYIDGEMTARDAWNPLPGKGLRCPIS